jgi:hypothetical protein
VAWHDIFVPSRNVDRLCRARLHRRPECHPGCRHCPRPTPVEVSCAPADRFHDLIGYLLGTHVICAEMVFDVLPPEPMPSTTLIHVPKMPMTPAPQLFDVALLPLSALRTLPSTPNTAKTLLPVSGPRRSPVFAPSRSSPTTNRDLLLLHCLVDARRFIAAAGGTQGLQDGVDGVTTVQYCNE